MAYLVVKKNDGTRHSISARDEKPNKPYLVCNRKYFPLTTETNTNSVKVKVKGQSDNYFVMEKKTVTTTTVGYSGLSVLSSEYLTETTGSFLVSFIESYRSINSSATNSYIYKTEYLISVFASKTLSKMKKYSSYFSSSYISGTNANTKSYSIILNNTFNNSYYMSYKYKYMGGYTKTGAKQIRSYSSEKVTATFYYIDKTFNSVGEQDTLNGILPIYSTKNNKTSSESSSYYAQAISLYSVTYGVGVSSTSNISGYFGTIKTTTTMEE